MSMQVEITGVDGLKSRLKELSERLYSDEAQSLFTNAAKVIAASARSRAPQSAKPKLWKASGHSMKVWHLPKTLKKAIIGKGFTKTYARLKFGPGAFVQVNLKRNYRNTAPYGHIVEFGRKSYRPFTGRLFFRGAVSEIGPHQLERITSAYKRLIERRYA